MKKLFVFAVVVIAMGACVTAQDIQLPAPQKTGGKPLMEVLEIRQTGREYSTKALDNQTLSDLLWATYGFNRNNSDRRTAPSANNKQAFSVYVCLQSGAYLYDAKNNVLKLVVAKDLRALTGKQDFVKDAPVNLVFAYDKTITTDQKYGFMDCGYLSQNVYLYAASAGLSTVARGWMDVEELAKALNLDKNLEIALAQTVGFPK